MAKVTLASLDQKLEFVVEQLNKVVYTIDGNGKPGLKTRIELVESKLKEDAELKQETRKINWSTILACAASVVAGVLIKFLAG